MVALHPFPRGFLIQPSHRAHDAPPNWAHVGLGAAEWVFSHDPLLPPDLAWSEDGEHWVLVHGLCLDTGDDAERCGPAEMLVRAVDRGENQFLNALDRLGGRFVVLMGTVDGFRVFHDATGMRSVYYSPEALTISSHVHAINDVHPHPERTDAQGRRGCAKGWDRTPYVGIHPLLPNHLLDVTDWSVERYFPRETNRYAGYSHEQRVTEFRRIWDRHTERLVATGSKLVMSLTGGADSRTSLALTRDHLDAVETFTYTVDHEGNSAWSRSMALDKALVEQIKDLVPVQHQYFYFGTKNLPHEAEIRSVLTRNTVQHHGQWLVPHYANAFPQDDVIHLRGNGYEIGRAYWGVTGDNNSIDQLWALYRKRTQQDAGHEPEEARRADFDRGLTTWDYLGDLHGYHVRDLFYWEVRCGRWLSEILNETDVAFQTCVPMNVRALLELSLAYPVAQRSAGFLFSELINASCPVLNFPGKNDPRNLYEQVRDAATSGPQLAPGEVELTPTGPMRVRTEHDGAQSVSVSEPTAYVPRDDFVAGTSCALAVPPAPGLGDLSMTVESPYANATARGTWYVAIRVDGEDLYRWDGALRRRAVHVSISNVASGTRVELVVGVLKDHRGQQSWQQASRTTVAETVFTPVTGQRENAAVRVTADIESLPLPPEAGGPSGSGKLTARPASADATPVPMSLESSRTFIYGSCVTRDAYELPGAPTLAEYVARSPLLSSMAPKPRALPARMDLDLIASPFQRRSVHRDLTKALPGLLRSRNYDHLVVDLIDERLAVAPVNGGMLTYGVESRAAGFVPPSQNRITMLSDDFLERWTPAAQDFAQLVADRRVILNRVMWADVDENGQPLPERFAVAQHNAVLARMYDILEDLLGCESISYPSHVVVADSAHRWGLSPFHYVPAFYQHYLRMLAQLVVTQP